MKAKVRLIRTITEECEVEIDVPPEFQFCVDDMFHQSILSDKIFEVMEERRFQIEKLVVKAAQICEWKQVDVSAPMIEPVYDEDVGDDEICICGHRYYRHFDGYDDNRGVGCKYCSCDFFVKKEENNGSN